MGDDIVCEHMLSPVLISCSPLYGIVYVDLVLAQNLITDTRAI
jgi:hypothetical protein